MDDDCAEDNILDSFRKSANQGGHKVGEKNFPEFSTLFHSHNYTFPEVITTKSVLNNDLHISRVFPHYLQQGHRAPGGQSATEA